MIIEYDSTLTISIQVTDWEASRNWYQDVLELPLAYAVEEIKWCEFETGIQGTTIGLTQTDEVQPGTAVTPTLGVKDIDIVRETLTLRGVEFAGDTVTIAGMVKLANFQDPDGNSLCLAQSLAG
jgi:predicted enzyme related to lactoylglutathione lyase